MSLAVSGYVKQFYRGNIFGATANGRTGHPAHSLISPDIKAVRRAVKELGSYDYDEGEGSELMNKVQAFVNTYNNYVDSAKGLEDSNADRYLSKLKKLTNENVEELSDIGITVQSSGKLKVDKEVLQDATRYQVSKVFSSDAEYGTQVEKLMKQTNNMILRNNLTVPKKSTAQKKDADKADNTQSAGIHAALAQQMEQMLTGSRIDFQV